jgi:MFS family permease
MGNLRQGGESLVARASATLADGCLKPQDLALCFPSGWAKDGWWRMRAVGGYLRRWGGGEPWYLAIGLANLVMGTSSILVPLMVSQVLHHTVADLGILSSLASLCAVIGSLLWGGLSDAAHRRKPFIVLSFAAVSAGFLGIGLGPSFWAVVLANMGLSFFWMANAAVSVLIVTENCDKALWERRIGRLNQTGAIGWVAGLVLGSVGLAVAKRWLQDDQAIRVLFLVLALGAAGAAILAIRLVPKTTSRFSPLRFRGVIAAVGDFLVEAARFSPYHLYHRLNLRNVVALLEQRDESSRQTKRFLLATLLAFASVGFFGVPLPLLLSERFGFSSPTVFLFFVILNVGVVVAYPWASHRIDRFGNKAVQTAALLTRLALYLVAAVFLAVSRSVPQALVIVLYFLGIGLSWSFFQLSGVALTSRLARPELRGQTLGLYNAVAGLGSIVAGVGSGYLAHRFGYQAPTAVAAILVGLALLILRGLCVPQAGVEEREDAVEEPAASPPAP